MEAALDLLRRWIEDRGSVVLWISDVASMVRQQNFFDSKFVSEF